MNRDNAVALRHLATYFRVKSLFEATRELIDKNFNSATAVKYLIEAAVYGDSMMEAAAKDQCRQSFYDIPPDEWVELSPDLFCDVLEILTESEVDRKIHNHERPQASEIMARYCRAHPEAVNDRLFSQLGRVLSLSASKSSSSDSEEEEEEEEESSSSLVVHDPMYWLDLAAQHPDCDTEMLRQRCHEACAANWQTTFLCHVQEASKRNDLPKKREELAAATKKASKTKKSTAAGREATQARDDLGKEVQGLEAIGPFLSQFERIPDAEKLDLMAKVVQKANDEKQKLKAENGQLLSRVRQLERTENHNRAERDRLYVKNTELTKLKQSVHTVVLDKLKPFNDLSARHYVFIRGSPQLAPPATHQATFTEAAVEELRAGCR